MSGKTFRRFATIFAVGVAGVWLAPLAASADEVTSITGSVAMRGRHR